MTILLTNDITEEEKECWRNGNPFLPTVLLSPVRRPCRSHVSVTCNKKKKDAVKTLDQITISTAFQATMKKMSKLLGTAKKALISREFKRRLAFVESIRAKAELMVVS